MSKNTLDDLKERIKRINEYHREEYAKRLDEIGGLGVGGTELKYRPLQQGVFMADTPEKEKQLVLMKSIPKLWEEATWSYVYGHFRACIVLLAIMIERALKLEVGKTINVKGMQLSSCIRLCKSNGIFPNNDNNDIVKAAKSINKVRNDVVHANIELNRARSLLLYTGSEHERVPLEDMPEEIRNCVVTKNWKRTYLSPEEESKVSIIYGYKKAARKTIRESEKVLKYLYPK